MLCWKTIELGCDRTWFSTCFATETLSSALWFWSPSQAQDEIAYEIGSCTLDPASYTVLLSHNVVLHQRGEEQSSLTALPSRRIQPCVWTWPVNDLPYCPLVTILLARKVLFLFGCVWLSPHPHPPITDVHFNRTGFSCALIPSYQRHEASVQRVSPLVIVTWQGSPLDKSSIWNKKPSSQLRQNSFWHKWFWTKQRTGSKK